jgi:VCBS repeat-containing protein
VSVADDDLASGGSATVQVVVDPINTAIIVGDLFDRVTEDSRLTADGDVLYFDPDNTVGTGTWSSSYFGDYGILEIDQNSGDWTYTLDNESAHVEALARLQIVEDLFTVTLTDEDGATVSEQLTIEVVGEQDLDQEVFGTNGDDVLFGADGNDQLIGRDGDDLFVFVDGAGEDLIVDFESNQNEQDRLDVSDFGFTDLTDLLASTSDVGSSAVISLDDDDSVTLVGVPKAFLESDDFIF